MNQVSVATVSILAAGATATVSVLTNLTPAAATTVVIAADAIAAATAAAAAASGGAAHATATFTACRPGAGPPPKAGPEDGDVQPRWTRCNTLDARLNRKSMYEDTAKYRRASGAAAISLPVGGPSGRRLFWCYGIPSPWRGVTICRKCPLSSYLAGVIAGLNEDPLAPSFRRHPASKQNKKETLPIPRQALSVSDLDQRQRHHCRAARARNTTAEP